ncbi:DUF6175 family protein [Empedobacter falsenii]
MKKLLNIFFLFFLSTAYCQTKNTVQPKIIVIPFSKSNENIRDVLERDVNLRIATTKIKESFDNRGFSTVDLIAKIKATNTNSAFNILNASDYKTEIINNSGADIYVQAEISINKTSTGTSVDVILTGFDTSTGNSLSNKVSTSGKFYTDDIGKLTSRATELIADDFLDTLQNKFDDIVLNGKSVNIEFGIMDGSDYTFYSEDINNSGLPFSDIIEEWMENNSYKNNYHIQGTTEFKMIFDDVKIPLKDPKNGNNYNSNKFALEIFKFMKSLNLDVTKDIKNNTIYINIK